MKKQNELSPAAFFVLGAVGLLGLLGEYGILAAESVLFDKSYNEFSITESVTHWIVVCVLWGLLGLVMFYVTARFYHFDILKKENKPSSRGIVIALLLLSTSIGVKNLLLGSWQIALDFEGQGWFQFIFLYIYHLFEAGLLLLSAAFLQEGCERLIKIKNEHIPWGGALAAIPWGIIHLFVSNRLALATNSPVTAALFYAAAAFFIGCSYLAAHKNIYYSYIFAAVLIIM